MEQVLEETEKPPANLRDDIDEGQEETFDETKKFTDEVKEENGDKVPTLVEREKSLETLKQKEKKLQITEINQLRKSSTGEKRNIAETAETPDNVPETEEQEKTIFVGEQTE